MTTYLIIWYLIGFITGIATIVLPKPRSLTYGELLFCFFLGIPGPLATLYFGYVYLEDIGFWDRRIF